MADSGRVRKLTVTACDPIHNGVGKNDKPYTIYEVFAVDEGGAPVEAKLRSFDRLRLNELVEYEITRRDDAKHGTSYTLKKPGKLAPPPDPRAMAADIEDLRSDVAALKTQLAAHERKLEDILRFLNSGDKPPAELVSSAGGAMASTGIPV